MGTKDIKGKIVKYTVSKVTVIEGEIECKVSDIMKMPLKKRINRIEKICQRCTGNEFNLFSLSFIGPTGIAKLAVVSECGMFHEIDLRLKKPCVWIDKLSINQPQGGAM